MKWLILFYALQIIRPFMHDPYLCSKGRADFVWNIEENGNLQGARSFMLKTLDADGWCAVIAAGGSI